MLLFEFQKAVILVVFSRVLLFEFLKAVIEFLELRIFFLNFKCPLCEVYFFSKNDNTFFSISRESGNTS